MLMFVLVLVLMFVRFFSVFCFDLPCCFVLFRFVLFCLVWVFLKEESVGGRFWAKCASVGHNKTSKKDVIRLPFPFHGLFLLLDSSATDLKVDKADRADGAVHEGLYHLLCPLR